MVFNHHPPTFMKNKTVLELADIKMIATAAEAEAVKHGWAVSIAIVDDGGNMLWFQRLDGAAPISALIAPAKARTSAMGRRESKIYEDMINGCLLYTSPSPRDRTRSRMPSSA